MNGTGSIWGRRLGFGRAPLLLMVDFARAFTEPPRPLAADATDVIAASNRLIATARDNAVPVLFTTVGYERDDLGDAGLWALKIGGQADLRLGSDGVEIDPRMGRRADESVLVKKYASCFFGTDLSSRLNAAGIDTVVICGLTTSGCIRATAVDAIQHGYRPIVVRDAVADRWPAAHEQALLDLDAKYADVIGLEEAVTGIAAAAE